MPNPFSKSASGFTDAARKAALAAEAARRAEPDIFGSSEMFVVEAGDQSLTWELWRLGGVLLERGIVAFGSQALARAAGKAALASSCASPGPPMLKGGRTVKPLA